MLTAPLSTSDSAGKANCRGLTVAMVIGCLGRGLIRYAAMLADVGREDPGVSKILRRGDRSESCDPALKCWQAEGRLGSSEPSAAGGCFST